MTAQLKAELDTLEGKIHAFMSKDMLKLVTEGFKAEGKAMRATKDKEIAELKVQVEACKQEVSTVVENEIQNNKGAIDAVEASVSKVQKNVEKKVHTWAEMAKDAKPKVDAVDKEVKECAPWIKVVKKNKGMPSNQTEIMNATLEEEAKRKAAMYDTQDEVFCELNPCDLDMQRMAQDAGDVTEYGTHFLALGSAHGLLIYNGLPQWPGSDALTCWNTKGGSNDLSPSYSTVEEGLLDASGGRDIPVLEPGQQEGMEDVLGETAEHPHYSPRGMESVCRGLV
ncbi:hypothetical protein L7F22_017278 [Adiantum nelumboides]|nr:hypothetical protein [Adiantum nelumboides]